MFEMLGLLFDTVVLFGLAAVLSAVTAGGSWFVVRRQRRFKLLTILSGASIPFAYAAYSWMCVALLPGESFFGDINQPLPNGYSLRALGKMPDFASIYDSDTGEGSASYQTEEIGSLAVEGPLVVGHYSHPYSAFEPSAQEPYFVFDTRTAKNVDFPDLIALEGRLGHWVHLADTTQFRSTEPRGLRQQKRNRLILFTRGLAATVLYVGLLVWVRRTERIQNARNERLYGINSGFRAETKGAGQRLYFDLWHLPQDFR